MQSLLGEPEVGQIVTSKVTQTAPSLLDYPNLSRGSRPGRGLLYSSLVHEIAIFSLLLASAAHPLPEETRQLESVQMIDLSNPAEVVYLPRLGGGSEGNGRPGGRSGARHRGSPAAAAASSKGFSYPGPQLVISDPPRPTNRIQTILQPGLVNPPALKVPFSMPNMVQMAEAGPAPIVERPKPAPPAVAETHPQPQPQAQPPPPAPAPFVPIIPKIEPPAIAPAEPPKLELPSVTPKDSSPVPQSKVPEPPPKPVAKPAEPPPPLQFSQLPTHGTDQHNVLALSPMPAPPDQPVKLPAGEAQGRFAISPEANTESSTPTPGRQGEKAGSSAIGIGNQGGTSGADAVGTGGSVAGHGAGAAAGEGGGGTGQPGEGSGTGGKGSGTGTGNGEGSGQGGTGDGNGRGSGVGNGVGHGPGLASGSGTGAGAGAGPGSGGFPGITIQGGSLTGAAGAASKSNHHPETPAPPQTSYGLTIVANGSSGGGLPDFGVFFDEKVYTVYINMKQTADDPAPSWTLQYALLRSAATQGGEAGKSGQSQQGLVPPFPIAKELPQLPIGLIFRHLHSVVVVYAVINKEGKLERMHVLQSPGVELNNVLLESLGKWVFKPAELNGEAVPVKVLLGIPLVMPE